MAKKKVKKKEANTKSEKFSDFRNSRTARFFTRSRAQMLVAGLWGALVAYVPFFIQPYIGGTLLVVAIPLVALFSFAMAYFSVSRIDKWATNKFCVEADGEDSKTKKVKWKVVYTVMTYETFVSVSWALGVVIAIMPVVIFAF